MPKSIIVQLSKKRLAGLTWGSQDNPPLIALHGWLDNAASFNELAPLLAQDYYVIALDLPGHGHSDHFAIDTDYQPRSVVECIVQLLDVLQYKKVTVVGHSLGAVIASVLASEFAHRVEHLVMIDAIGPLSAEAMNSPSDLSQSIHRILRQGPVRAEKIYPNVNTMIQARMRASGFNESQARALVERNTKAVTGGYSWRFDKRLLAPSPPLSLSEDEVHTQLAAIEAPCLLLEATHGLIHGNARVAARKKIFSQLVVNTVTGHHHVHLENPHKIALAIFAFLGHNET